MQMDQSSVLNISADKGLRLIGEAWGALEAFNTVEEKKAIEKQMAEAQKKQQELEQKKTQLENDKTEVDTAKSAAEIESLKGGQ